jgi:hypothetical protein
MSRKIRIASTLALAGFLLTAAPVAASAGSPLLSGYGGPGTGEQAIVGSTLLNAPRGGAGSGGSLGTGSTSSAGTGRGGIGGAPSNGARGGLAGAAGSAGGSTSSKGGVGSSASQVGSARVNRADAYVYPSSPGSAPNSPVIGISSGDLPPLLGIIATLMLIGVLTLRLARLQR